MFFFFSSLDFNDGIVQKVMMNPRDPALFLRKIKPCYEAMLKWLKHQYQHSFITVAVCNDVISQETYNNKRDYYWWILQMKEVGP